MGSHRFIALAGLAISLVAVGAVVASSVASAEGASGAAVPNGVIVSVVSAPVKDYPLTRSWLEASTLTGADRRRLTRRPLRGERQLDDNPAIAPDGSTVAFTRWRPAGSSLWLVGVDGSNPRLLVRPAQLRALLGARASLGELVWSSDGSKLLAVVDAPGCRSRGLLAISVDSASVQLLLRLKPRTYATVFAGGWSPDGSEVAYVTKYNDGECLTTHEGWNVLSIASADGRHHRGLLRTGVIGDVSWSPDGRRVVYSGHCDEICNLYLLAPDGSHRRRLTGFEDPYAGVWAYVDLSFAWWRGHLLYARPKRLSTLDPNTGAASRLRNLPCPVARQCSDPTSPPQISIDDVSSDFAVVDQWLDTDSTSGDFLQVAALPSGPVVRLPYPRPLRRGDALDWYTVALLH
jgi:dipeptidyl aminopeptidase/acylaminoacyl peptidase